MMTHYFDTGTKIPRFLHFPMFLLNLNISLTAKVLYAELLGRVTLSQRNDWTDDQGRVYIIYDNATLMRELNKSLSTIKAALRELEAADLLDRQSVPGRANLLFVKLPAGQDLDPVKKSTSPRAENDLPDGQDSDLEGDSNMSPNNLNKETRQENRDKSSVSKAYGRYQNLFFTDEEYALLQEAYPFDLDRYIEELSTYMAASDKHYNNHEAALRMWASRDRKAAARQVQVNDDYYEGDDTL